MAVIFLESGGSGPGGDTGVMTATVQTGAIYNGTRSPTTVHPNVDTAVKEHGYSSIKATATAAPVSSYVARNGCLGTTRRISIRSRFSGAWSSTNSPGTGFLRVLATGATEIFSLTVGTTGVVRLAAGSTVLGTSSGSALTAGNWYRFSLCYTITNTTTYDIRVYQDGVQIISSTNGLPTTLTSAAPADLRIGFTGSAMAANAVHNFQDVYVDDTAGLADPGNVRVTAKRPAALGATNAFDTLTGATDGGRMGYVNDRPIDTANRITHAATSAVVREQFTVEAANVGDDNLTGVTILDWAGWTHFTVVVGAGSVLAKPVVNGVDQAYTTVAASGAYQTTYHLAGSTSYPSSNTAIGLASTGTAVDTSLGECGVMIAYTPAVAGTRYRSIMMVG